jgi:UDP-glucose 4-epimerase
MNILITGGAGYIGSHTAVELLNYGRIKLMCEETLRGLQASIFVAPSPCPFC